MNTSELADEHLLEHMLSRYGLVLTDDPDLDHSEETFAKAKRGFLTALRDSTDRDAWQPIETAPRDGRPIRLFDPEYCDEEMNPTLEGHWSDSAHDDAGGFQAAVWNNTQDYFATVDVKPTHWRPLPAPPSSEGRVDQ